MVRGTDLVGGVHVPGALQRAKSAFTRVFDALWLLRRTGIQKGGTACGEMGPGSAAHRRRSAALRPGHETEIWRAGLSTSLRGALRRSNPDPSEEDSGL